MNVGHHAWLVTFWVLAVELILTPVWQLRYLTSQSDSEARFTLGSGVCAHSCSQSVTAIITTV